MFDTSVLAPNSPVIPTSVGLSIIFAYILDYAKRIKQVPKVTYYTTKLNSILRLIMSGVGTLGVSYVWSSTPAGGHQLLITIPSAAALGSGVFHWAVAYATQHFSEIQLAQRDVAKQAQQVQKDA